MSPKCRILLVDDHAVVREGIKRILERHADFEVVGECQDGRTALQEISRLNPDVAMLDISMPGLSGFETTRQAKATCPTVQIVALTIHEDEAYVRELLKAGASGYVLKRTQTEELVGAIRTVARGNIYIDPRVANDVVRSFTRQELSSASATIDLSERETAVLRAIALGYSNKEIGADLKLSVKTVETYKARAAEKLGLRSRVDIVRFAAQKGWLKG